MNLFKKVACFTDIHFGLRNNEREHNKDCLKFIDWFVEQAKEFDAETCIFLGDFNHYRYTLNISTMNYNIRALQKLNDAFEKTFFILGNHDLFYKEKRTLNSIEFGRLFPNIILIDKPLTLGQVIVLPWLVENEWKKIKNLKSKYVFGHLELPHFKMNAMIEMPDTGTFKIKDFEGPDFVFSGHFHKRQIKENIIYIGNTFPHNFADAWDDERGMMLLEWDEAPEFRNWPDAPKYRTLLLTELLSDPEKYIVTNTYARVTIDTDTSYEEANYIKEILTECLGAKKISLISNKQDDYSNQDFSSDIEFETVDEIVIKQLGSIESTTFEAGLLINIYNSL